MPKASAASSTACRPTPASSSSKWKSRTSIISTGSLLPWPSSNASPRGGGKSTVATITEVYHFLRLLYAKLGTQYCPTCQVPVATTTLAEWPIKSAPPRKRPVQVFAPLVKSRKGYHKEVAEWAVRHDFYTLLVDGKLIKADKFPELSRYREHSIDVLVGQISKASEEDAIALARRALEIGKNTARLSAERRANCSAPKWPVRRAPALSNRSTRACSPSTPPTAGARPAAGSARL